MSLSYCATQVRELDRDRFHLALLAPSHAQQGFMALTAFSLELSRVALKAREAQLALMRLQWWKEAVAEVLVGKAAKGHQVLQGLAEHCPAHVHATLSPLLASIADAHAGAIDAGVADTGFESLESLTKFLCQTQGNLARAQACLLLTADDESADLEFAPLANHMACVMGFTTLARTIGAQQADALLREPFALGPLPPPWREQADRPGLMAEITGRAAMHLERAQELRAELARPLSGLWQVTHLVKGWQNRLPRLPLGSGKFMQPLPAQALRLALVRS